MNRNDGCMRRGNRFKLGLFASNCSNGLTMTLVPEAWDASWENNVEMARLAEEMGLEFLLPVARWHGYGGKTDTEGTSFETLTWASGLLASTRNIVVFGTVHVPLVNPVWAAKQIVTADHIGRGRFGLNVVSGYNESEFRMFGVEMREHDERYIFTEEWLAIVKRIWSEGQPFEHKGKYFHLREVRSRPKPYAGQHPMIMSAGSSPAGRAFARRHADCLFMAINRLETLAAEIAALREGLASHVGVYASGPIFCRPKQKEAEEYYHYVVYEKGDWEAVENVLRIRSNQKGLSIEDMKRQKERLINVATYPIIGSPDTVAQTFKTMSEAGMDGMAVGLVNYVNDLPLIGDEVLPRMERLGIRSFNREKVYA